MEWSPGIALKVARAARGVSQADTAEALGVSRPTLIKTENGERKLTASELRKAVEFLDFPREWFTAKVPPWLQGSAAEPPPQSGDDDGAPPGPAESPLEAIGVPPEHADYVMDLFRALLAGRLPVDLWDLDEHYGEWRRDSDAADFVPRSEPLFRWVPLSHREVVYLLGYVEEQFTKVYEASRVAGELTDFTVLPGHGWRLRQLAGLIERLSGQQAPMPRLFPLDAPEDADSPYGLRMRPLGATPDGDGEDEGEGDGA